MNRFGLLPAGNDLFRNRFAVQIIRKTYPGFTGQQFDNIINEDDLIVIDNVVWFFFYAALNFSLNIIKIYLLKSRELQRNT